MGLGLDQLYIHRGIRTNGHCEVKNCITKCIGGLKKTLFQLFYGLNEQTDGQTVQEMICVHDVSLFRVLHLCYPSSFLM